MGAAALTEYQGHQEYQECMARMAGKLGVQVNNLRDYFAATTTLRAELTRHC